MKILIIALIHIALPVIAACHRPAPKPPARNVVVPKPHPAPVRPPVPTTPAKH